MKSQNLKNDIINLLTLCRKAGKMQFGFDAAKDSALSGQAGCVLITEDVSSKTLKETEYFCSKSGVPMFKTTLLMDDVERFLGKRAGVLAVCGDGFAERLSELFGGNPGP